MPKSLAVLLLVLVSACGVQAPAGSAGVDWTAYAADAGGTHYSPLADIDTVTVTALQPAWTWSSSAARVRTSTGSVQRPGYLEVTPLVRADTMYLVTPMGAVEALDAGSGRSLWSWDPDAVRWAPSVNRPGFVHRGLSIWTDGVTVRLFVAVRWRLFSIDPATGRPDPAFGDRGSVSLASTQPDPADSMAVHSTSPPAIWRNLVIAGSSLDDDRLESPPDGAVQAFDARTGRRAWTFRTIPAPGDDGSETWPAESRGRVGHANVWAPMTLDVVRGLLFLPVSTPTNDWYGGDRLGTNLYAESIVCLDAATGVLRWHAQLVHHGLWDYDPPSGPTLVTIPDADGDRAAVALAGKTGFLYVFDRRTGAPVWPIEERQVPVSDVPGEQAWPTQPFPTAPAPFSRQGFSLDDVADFSPAIQANAREALRGLRLGPLFTPPSREGTVVMPGWTGGAGWGGAGYDSSTHTLFVKASNLPTLARLIPWTDEAGRQSWRINRDAMTMTIPAGPGAGLPIAKPPYGTLTAIDLRTGEYRWQVPAGDTPEVRQHPDLRGLTLSGLGASGPAGPLVTAGGLVFVGGGPVLQAFRTRDGALLWTGALPGANRATPMTYRTSRGRQFVAVASGTGYSGTLTVFALPRNAAR